MKQTLGFGMVLAVAVAATRLGGGTGGQEVPQAAAADAHAPAMQTLVTATTQVQAYAGGCAAFEPAPATAKYPYNTSGGAAKGVLDTFFGGDAAVVAPRSPAVHYAIALAPDPVHTQLSLMFDRQMVVIQQAAQDEGYTYDSSWLPWQTGSPYPLLADQQVADDITSDREACPGVLLFRRSLNPGLSDAYKEALVVLVVGEQPTAGVNEDQWTNAVVWLKRNAAATEVHQNGEADTAALPRVLRVLGPTFSGSLVSLERDLSSLSPNGAFPNASSPIHVLAGTTSSCSSILWFQQRLASYGHGGNAIFGSFSENDELRIYRFLSYIRDQGTRPSETAILSEDETAYGGPAQSVGDACDFPYDRYDQPVRLFFPRDISSLRSAYEKQSVFSGANVGSNRSTGGSHPILHEDTAGQAGTSPSASDTIPAYGGDTTPLEQEAILYGIVSNLRMHHTRYIILRCTNPLDYLFLIRFFHRGYPEGRIVTVGADLLFRREIDTTEFRGVLALSNYPLLPRDQHWTSLSVEGRPSENHAHRVFESNSEGTYIAARYLFGSQNSICGGGCAGPPQSSGSPESSGSPGFRFKPNIPEFADPFWMHQAGETLPYIQAPTWLAAVGRDGYWPIAVLNDHSKLDAVLYTRDEKDEAHPPGPPPSTLVRVAAGPDVSYELSRRSADGRPGFDPSLLFGLPIPWKVCTACALFLLLYQGFGLWQGYKLTSSGLFAVFRRVPERSQAVLIGINTGIAAAILLSLLSIGFTRPSVGELFGVDPLLGVAGVLCAVVAPLVLLWLHSVRPRLAVICFGITLLMFAAFFYFAFWLNKHPVNEVPLFYRMGHLTSGVSPLLPVLLLLAGFYLSTWRSLAGNSLLCGGRPMLPALEDQAQYRIGAEMGARIVQIANPLWVDVKIVLVPACVTLLAVWLFARDLPLLGMESVDYAVCINVALLMTFVLTTAETARLYLTWVELKRLLTVLGRLPLQRTFARLHAVDCSSLWSISGNVQRIQYSFFVQQLDAARRLSDLLSGRPASVYPRVKLLKAVASGNRFAEVCAPNLNVGSRWEDKVHRLKDPIWLVEDGSGRSGYYIRAWVRRDLNSAVTEVMESILIPDWNTETVSLSLDDSPVAMAQEAGEDKGLDLKLSDDMIVRTAEEFVCFHYLAFIQSIIARMRTMAISMIGVFVSVCLAISFYPFVPRTQIGLWMLLDLMLIASTVIPVYAGMERDKTLSYITNTKPKLSTEFYLKTAGFLTGPILGLITTQFPAISESILSWLQPGAVK